MYVDRTTNQKGSGVGLALKSPEKTILEKSLKLGFSAMNNEAEYEALLQGMAMVQKMGEKALEMFSDSRLVMGRGKERVGSQRCKDARVLKPGQMPTVRL